MNPLLLAIFSLFGFKEEIKVKEWHPMKPYYVYSLPTNLPYDALELSAQEELIDRAELCRNNEECEAIYPISEKTWQLFKENLERYDQYPVRVLIK